MKFRLNIVYSSCHIIISVIGLSLTACQMEHNAVHDLFLLRTEIVENHAQYTQSEWEDAISTYNEICKRLDNMSFTKEERIEIEKIKGEIAGYTAGIIIKETVDKVQDIIDEVDSFSEGFFETILSQ